MRINVLINKCKVGDPMLYIIKLPTAVLLRARSESVYSDDTLCGVDK